jgi:aspartate/methionine/tyrosine aminotransferase
MIYSREELEAIGNWAVEHDLLILADDIYGRLVYNGNTFTPISSISEHSSTDHCYQWCCKSLCHDGLAGWLRSR